MKECAVKGYLALSSFFLVKLLLSTFFRLLPNRFPLLFWASLPPSSLQTIFATFAQIIISRIEFKLLCANFIVILPHCSPVFYCFVSYGHIVHGYICTMNSVVSSLNLRFSIINWSNRHPLLHIGRYHFSTCRGSPPVYIHLTDAGSICFCIQNNVIPLLVMVNQKRRHSCNNIRTER